MGGAPSDVGGRSLADRHRPAPRTWVAGAPHSVRACPRPPGAHGDAAHGGEAPLGTPPDRTAPTHRVAAAPEVRHAGGGSPETLRRFTRSARPGRADQRCDASQGVWGAAHRRVGDANDDLNESICSGVRVVRGEDLESECRRFESDPCAFSLHTPFAQRPTTGAPHCADGVREGAQ